MDSHGRAAFLGKTLGVGAFVGVHILAFMPTEKGIAQINNFAKIIDKAYRKGTLTEEDFE